MSKKDHATLLGRKIFSANNADEVSAFLGLDLDVNWLDTGKDFDFPTLVEQAFRVIKAPSDFALFWDNVQRNHPGLNLWSRLSSGTRLVDRLFQPSGMYTFKTDLIDQCPENQQNWQDVLPHIVHNALLPTWPALASFLKQTSVPPSVLSACDDFRTNNLFIKAENVTSFKQLRPSVLNSDHALGMFAHLSSRAITPKNVWYVEEFLAADWNSWSTEQAKVLGRVKTPLATSALLAAQSSDPNAFSNASPMLERMLPKLEKFYKNVAVDGSGEFQRFLRSDVSALSEFRLNGQTLEKRLLRMLGKSTHALLDNVLAQDKNPVYFEYALLSACIDTACVRATQFSEKALRLFAQSDVPSSALDVEQCVQRCLLEEKSVSLPSRLGMIVAHAALRLPPAHQASLLQSLFESKTFERFPEEMSIAMLSWSMRGMDAAQSEPEKRNWANVFWNSVFNVPSANQHYWFKKIHGRQDFVAPVACWANLEQQVMDAQSKRRSTPEIQSVLSKMALVNVTASEADQKDDGPRRRSKL